MPKADKINWGPSLIGTALFYFLQVYMPIYWIAPRVESIPLWVFKFASWWGFAYVCNLIWVKGKYPIWYALSTAFLFLILVLIDFTLLKAYSLSFLYGIMGSPALVILGIALGLFLKGRLSFQK